MSTRPNYGPSRDNGEIGMRVLEGLAKVGVWGGGIGAGVSIVFMMYTMFRTGSGATPAEMKQAIQNVETFSTLLLVSISAFSLAGLFIWWGEEVLGPLFLIGGAIFFFTPTYLPGAIGSGAGLSGPQGQVLKSLSIAGAIAAGFGILFIFIDVVGRVRLRARQGAKADQLKYGKGIREVADIRNVFMGKCWQLPYCRKFVREKCPIYHAKRTCWKERVGCMCEEAVIQNAMEGKVIPKDQLTAAKFIPYNNKLSAGAKAERCRQCVIFNEHQKHKYKLALPMTMLGFVGAYFVGKEVFIKQLGVMIDKGNAAVNKATMQSGDAAKAAGESTMSWFKEVLLVCILLILIAYTMKVLEYLFFKAKV